MTAWLKNYKSMEPANALLEEAAEEVLENKTDSPIMQQINQTKLKVTARVIGVIKKMNKTYGGSLLNFD